MLETLKIRPVTQADKKYSLLISLPPPFNVFLFFFAPFLLTSKQPEQLNQKLLLLAYMPVLLASVLVFLIGEIIMWPFVYSKMVFHKLTMVWLYSKSFRVSRADKFMNFIFYTFLGVFLIPGNTLIDLYFFIRHLVRYDLQ